jgi:tetratricopeptide (TPR) repeat protein
MSFCDPRHSRTFAFQKERANPTTRQTRFGFIIAVVLALLSGACPAQAPKMTEEELKEFRKGFAEGVKEGLDEAKAVRKKIQDLQTSGFDFLNRGDYQQAENAFRASLALSIKQFGAESERAFLSQSALASALYPQEKDEEFAATFERMSDFVRTHSGGNSKRLLHLKIKYCGELKLPRDQHEALLDRLLIDVAILGAEFDLAVRSARACYFQRQGQPARALDELRAAIAKVEKDGGNDTIHSALARLDLAEALARIGNSAEAEQQIGKVLAWCTETFGPEHAFTQGYRGVCGVVRVRCGKFAEALPDLEAGLATIIKLRQEEGTAYGRILHAQAQALQALGRADEAAQSIAKARTAVQTAKGRKNFQVAQLEKDLQQWSPAKKK